MKHLLAENYNRYFNKPLTELTDNYSKRGNDLIDWNTEKLLHKALVSYYDILREDGWEDDDIKDFIIQAVEVAWGEVA